MNVQSTDKEKVPLVLFSGGLDSTYLLYQLLQSTDVDVLYVKGQQGSLKIEAETKARERIFKWFEKNGKYKIRNKYIFNLEYSDTIAEHTFGQVHVWLFGALNEYRYKLHSSVQIAYVLGDQIGCKIPYIQTAWDNLVLVSKQNKVELEFPLQFTPKSDILQLIHPDLLKLIWVCELPERKKNRKTITACGKCLACITAKVEQYRLTLLNNDRTIIQRKV